MNVEKSETDSKCKNLKKTCSKVELRKKILLQSRNRSRSKNHHYSLALDHTIFLDSAFTKSKAKSGSGNLLFKRAMKEKRWLYLFNIAV